MVVKIDGVGCRCVESELAHRAVICARQCQERREHPAMRMGTMADVHVVALPSGGSGRGARSPRGVTRDLGYLRCGRVAIVDIRHSNFEREVAETEYEGESDTASNHEGKVKETVALPTCEGNCTYE